MRLALAILLGLAMQPTAAMAMPPSKADPGFTALQPLVKAAYRRCAWHSGRRHCRWYSGSRRAYGYRAGRYYPTDPSRLRTGSRRWWDAKEREGSAGNRP
jgi:hypothetical protein